jgi:hypothetical protein
MGEKCIDLELTSPTSVGVHSHPNLRSARQPTGDTHAIINSRPCADLFRCGPATCCAPGHRGSLIIYDSGSLF